MPSYVNDKDFFIVGRCLGSKSGYVARHPGHDVVFNANLVTKGRGKVWHGDIDLTTDGEALKRFAARLGEAVYVLYEMDGRFGNEEDPKLDRPRAVIEP